MENIKRKIDNDFKKALKENNKIVIDVLKLTKSVIKNAEIEKRGDLSDDEIIDILSREVKKRKEAIELYKKGGRLELADKEQSEIEILNNYLPQKISRDEIREIVIETINKLKIKSPTEFGKIMGEIMPKIKNKADGKEVSRIVQEELNKI